MEGANHGFEVSDFILFLFDEYPKGGYFFLHAFDFLGIFLILLLQLPKKMVGLLLQVLNHQLLFLVGVDY